MEKEILSLDLYFGPWLLTSQQIDCVNLRPESQRVLVVIID